MWIYPTHYYTVVMGSLLPPQYCMSKIISILIIGFLIVCANAQNDMNNNSEIDPPEGYKFVSFLSEEQVRTFEEAEDVIEEGKDYGAIIVTNKGTLQIDFYEEAPKTVNNFIFLSLNHYYEGIVFHRVLENFMAQTGDPTGTGSGGPGYKFADEFVADLTHEGKGTLSMANSGPNTNGSQFFITFAATPWLDGKHSVFGQVKKGLEVLDEIQLIDPSNNRPTIVAYARDPLNVLQNQGLNLAGGGDIIIEDYIIDKLGSPPPIGEYFELEGFTGVMGNVEGFLAVGFHPQPDVIEAVYIIEKIEE